MYCSHDFRTIWLNSVTTQKSEIWTLLRTAESDGNKHLKWNTFNFGAIRYPVLCAVRHGSICIYIYRYIPHTLVWLLYDFRIIKTRKRTNIATLMRIHYPFPPSTFRRTHKCATQRCTVYTLFIAISYGCKRWHEPQNKLPIYKIESFLYFLCTTATQILWVS